MRARTIGQIATVIAGHMGGKTPAGGAPPAPAASVTEATPTSSEVDLEALSDEDLDRLQGDSAVSDEDPDPEGAVK
jgi:hypothetical protein